MSPRLAAVTGAMLAVLAILHPGAPAAVDAATGARSSRAAIASAYGRGLEFVARGQLETGEFPTYAWSVALGMDRKWPVRSVFTATQLLHSLGRDESARARLVRERAVGFLLAHREPPGVWRYFGKDAPLASGVLLSPDVDDTATAWAALVQQGHAVDPSALAAIRESRTPTGLFTTWVGDPSTWTGIDSRDTDMVVNVNALFLFALLGESVPDVCRQAVAHARTGAWLRGTPWYPSPMAFAYFASRAYADGKATCLGDALPPLRDHVLRSQKADGGWGDDLETALGVLTLLNAGDRGPALDRGVKALLARQGADGGWALAPHYTTVKPPSEPAVYFGSPLLTTGLCLEALGKYLRR